MAVDPPHLAALSPPTRILLAPGPTSLPPAVVSSLAAPVIGHKDPAFLRIMDDVAQLLRYVYQTVNPVSMSLPGTGGAGMESALANLIQTGDTAVICVNGLFGQRMADIAHRLGASVVPVEAPWGRAVDPQDVRRALAGVKARIVTVVHGETSTGVQQPIEDIGQIARENGAMLVVDTVATLGGVAVNPDEWGCSICFSASQKCLSAPPGLAPITASDSAMAYIRGRPQPVSSWYFDLSAHDQYWFAEERAYHHTAPVVMVYALREALRLVAEEGLEARFARHRLHHRAVAAGLQALEIEFFAEPANRLTTVLAVRVPEGVNDAGVRSRLLNDHRIEIAGGLGPWAGKIWRIGVMGHSASQENLLRFLSALETSLASEGYEFEPGASVAEATKVYASAASATPASI